ncbi:hypothetical protein PYCCODRAFT_4165 [Trametes coccinea BRFM310]|uniref:Uncharacterized protein n=1 Tax=Trametes coccinea (strain BRFM310) TaxID=1353009 RepID=A0A1Y2J4C8_TRAC3|nr:hypothetical protein PYCCODRAFT_4165 [Trametes coccinea BRFM310]
MSEANLLLVLPRLGDALQHRAQDVRACLIDFDYAKRVQSVAERTIPFNLTDRPLLPQFPPGIALSRLLPKTVTLTEDLGQRAVHLARVRGKRGASAFFFAVSYIHAAWQYHHHSEL